MDFAYLHHRLIGHLRQRVRSGEWTERGLARLTGVSQPHMHNVLKGIRLLSSETADQLLRHLRIDLADLMEAGMAPAEAPLVPLIEDWLGPGHGFPDLEAVRERVPVWWPCPEKLSQPVLVSLAADDAMADLFGGGDFALLDSDEHKRRHPRPDAYYVVATGGEGLVRRMRLSEDGVELVTPAGARNYVSFADRNILEIVKAKVVWIGRNLEPPRFAT